MTRNNHALRLPALLLALLLPVCALADDSRRWVEDITKLEQLPAANAERLTAGFARMDITGGADAAESALRWAETDVLHGSLNRHDDFSLFVQGESGEWLATLCEGDDTMVMTLDARGRLLFYRSENAPALPAYEGYLPEGTDEAVLSCIEVFAGMNGCQSVTDYERLGCTRADDRYDVRVTARAALDGVSCQFTLSLATMGFTAISCPLPRIVPMPAPTVSPDGVEDFSVTIGGETVTVQAIDKRTKGYAFSAWPEDALPREEVFATALQALMDEFGLTLADLTAEPFEYGYDMESSMHIWQLDFSSLTEPTGGMEYTVHVRDVDGAVTGVWGPDEANG